MKIDLTHVQPFLDKKAKNELESRIPEIYKLFNKSKIKSVCHGICIFSYLRSILIFRNHENRPLSCPTFFGRKNQE